MNQSIKQLFINPSLELKNLPLSSSLRKGEAGEGRLCNRAEEVD
jgi:hypothetical protein